LNQKNKVKNAKEKTTFALPYSLSWQPVCNYILCSLQDRWLLHFRIRRSVAQMLCRIDVFDHFIWWKLTDVQKWKYMRIIDLETKVCKPWRKCNRDINKQAFLDCKTWLIHWQVDKSICHAKTGKLLFYSRACYKLLLWGFK